MDCPLCTDQTLQPHHRGGIEIDVCPRCRGIWLDRGELDRLVGDDDGSVAAVRPDPEPAPPAPWAERHDHLRDGPVADPRPTSDRARDSRDDERRPEWPKRKTSKKRKSRAKRLADAFEDLFDDVLDL